MFKHTTEQQKQIDKLDCTYRCFKRTDQTNPARSGQVCEIIDKGTGQVYAEAMGATEPEALSNALRVAQRAAKPVTRAQSSEPEELQKRMQKVREEFYAEQGTVVDEDVSLPDPEPTDKRTRAWREWSQRQTPALKE